jgi:hypothetical protein
VLKYLYIMSCAMPKSDLETMQRQGCFYGADGKMTCQITGNPITMILNDKDTMFPGSVARGQKPTTPPTTNANTVEGFENAARSKMWGAPAFLDA